MRQSETVSRASGEFLGTGPPLITLLGAGVSRPAPSSIPLAPELIDIVLTRLESVGGISGELVDHVRLGVHQVGMPLEYFAQVLYGTLGQDFLRLVVSCLPVTGRFNRFHWAMARMAQRGRLAAIVTLNWDELIEQALDAAGLQRCEDEFMNTGPVGRYYRVLTPNQIANADLSPLRTTRTPGDTLLLLKLHGTISEPATIRSTVETYQSWFNLKRDTNLVRFLRSERYTIFVAGYSGRDEIFPRLFGRPGTSYRPQLTPAQTIYWLDRPGAVLTRGVRDLLKEPSVTGLAITAEDFADELLRGDNPPKESIASGDSVCVQDFFFPRMQCYNAIARLGLQLERYGGVCAIIRAGFAATGADESQGSHWIQGLAVIGRAKAGLRDFAGAAADLDRAIADWEAERHRPLDWPYRHAEMRLYRGVIAHERNRHITDQLLAYDELLAAHKEFLEWHDQSVQCRNFESSPEYAMVQYYFGLFMVHGRDLDRAERHFARLLDVDVFNDLYMARARKHYGNALCRQARGDLEGAIALAVEATRLVPETQEYFVMTDSLLLLASLHEAAGNRASAADTYAELSERLSECVGDEERARWAAERAQELRPFGHSLPRSVMRFSR